MTPASTARKSGCGEQKLWTHGGSLDFLDNVTYIDFLCECADMECTEISALTPAEYEAVRAYPERFPIKSGHDEPELERVVEENDRYVAGAELALHTRERGVIPRASGQRS